MNFTAHILTGASGFKLKSAAPILDGKTRKPRQFDSREEAIEYVEGHLRFERGEYEIREESSPRDNSLDTGSENE